MRRAVAFAIVACFASAAHAAANTRVLDDFEDASRWTAVASDQVTAKLRSVATPTGQALCLAYDFNGVSGYAAMRRDLPLKFPPNYALSFRARGEGPPNALQLKFADRRGENVWWINRPDFAMPSDWRELRFKKRQIEFAWGPTADRSLREAATVEFTIYASKGGRGEACFDALTLAELAPDSAAHPSIRADASSNRAQAANVVDGDATTAWRSASRSREQSLTLDLGEQREFGGLVLHWLAEAFASRYDVEFSDDRKRWRTVRRVLAGNGGEDPLFLPESEARYVRLRIYDGPTGAYALGEVEVKDLAFGATPNAFFAALAKDAPRGRFPRGFYNEQTYWTIVGVDGGHETGLFSEDGALEVARGGFSIEPFLIDGKGALTTWADVKAEQSLRDRYLPMPSVTWRHDDMSLDTTWFGSGDRARSELIGRYVVSSDADAPRDVTLALAIRPFQVNPSVQFLNTPGGVSPIHDFALEGDRVLVDGVARVRSLVAPDAFFATPFDSGSVVDRLASPPATRSVHDDVGLASAALLYQLHIPAHSRQTVGVRVPLAGAPDDAPIGDANTWLARTSDAVAADWHRKLDGTTLRLPAREQALADTLRTALAHILISRDGPALRPGTRSYARTWIRDGAMMAEALLRLGRADAATEFLAWYAPFQFDSGKVPCCVDARGADPVPENDSHGELIALVGLVDRYTHDRALSTTMWPHVDAAVRYMDALRASERTTANAGTSRFGLMPASISHEGYSAKPMHSYWDDFWSLAGYKAAVDIATALDKSDVAATFATSRDEFAHDLHASLALAMAEHDIAYLPGAAELGDFDATSTTIALSPAGEQSRLPVVALANTFEHYWNEFVSRRDGKKSWDVYTPYEWRTVGAFVRLGWRDRADEASRFFMADRRPAAWNQWAEVVGRNARESRFIGDMPHGWVASDFIRSTLDRFAYERELDHAIVLAAGVPTTWLAGDGIAIDGLRTPYGPLQYSLRRDGNAVLLKIGADGMGLPPGGFVLSLPTSMHIATATSAKHRLAVTSNEITIRALPADVRIVLASDAIARDKR